MARFLKPLVRSGGYYPSRRWTPLVYPGGYTTANGGEEPAPPPVEKTVIGNPIHILDALAKPAQALSVKLEPIQAGSGDPSPTNIRPISGWTGANVTRTGKNLLDPAYRYEIAATNNFHVRYYFQGMTYPYYEKLLLKKGVTYTFSFTGAANASGLYIYTSETNRQFIVYGRNAITFTPTEDCYGAVDVYWANEVDVANVVCQLELGSTATDYEPYAGNTYTIQLGDTVYGGTLDVTQGKLTVTMAIVDLGTFGWSKSSGTYGGFYATSKFYYRWASGTKMLCSRYKFDGVRGQASYFGANGTLTAYYREDVVSPVYEIYIKDKSLADKTASEFQTTMSGVQLVYELATPITIQLTPTQVELLQGENNIWSDGEMTLVYLADGNASDVEALNILLGGRYVNNHTEGESTDREALDIVLGGKK